jgi:hypothetical protein
MNYHVRRYRDSFIGIKGFREEFPEDFPAGDDETAQMDEIETVLGLIEQYGGEQALGFGNVRFNYNSKGIAREKLRGEMTDISTIAATYAYTIPGIDLVFHIPKNLPEAALLALARSFATQSAQYETQFIKRGLDVKFILNLQAAIDAFETSLTPAEASTDAQVEATAKLGEAVRRGMIARNIMKGILKIKYKNNPARMRAWLSASHLERDNNTQGESDAPPPTA